MPRPRDTNAPVRCPMDRAQEARFGTVGLASGTPFLRTPKYNVVGTGGAWKKKSYRAGVSMLSVFEVILALYFLVSIVFAIVNKLFLAVPILLLFLFGFLYVGGLSLWQRG